MKSNGTITLKRAHKEMAQKETKERVQVRPQERGNVVRGTLARR